MIYQKRSRFTGYAKIFSFNFQVFLYVLWNFIVTIFDMQMEIHESKTLFEKELKV